MNSLWASLRNIFIFLLHFSVIDDPYNNVTNLRRHETFTLIYTKIICPDLLCSITKQ